MNKQMKTCLLLALSAVLFITPITLYGEPQNTRTHKVEPGETAFSISKAYNISLNDLYTLNPEAQNGLKAGTLIFLPQTNATDKSNDKYIYHTIQCKETLYSVAHQYSVPLQSIVEANSGLTTNTFQEGRIIRIPKNAVQKPEFVVNYKLHKVQKKETVYSISHDYGVTTTALYDTNPELRTKGLKKGKMIKIPFYTEKKPTNTEIISQQNSANKLLFERTQIKTVHSVKIGLLLPFSDLSDQKSDRFVEYLEGFLLAVKNYKQKGLSAEVYVFDIESENKTTRLKDLLETEELRSLNVLIGGISDTQIQLLSSFAKKNHVHYVIPFTSKENDVLSNNYIFQINTPQEKLYPKICETFVNRFKSSNVIFINDVDNDKKDFTNTLKSYLDKAQIKNTTIRLSDNNTETNLSALLSNLSQNILIPTSATPSTLNKLFPTLESIKKSNPNYPISLFGYPRWQAIDAQTENNLHKFDTYFYSTFYADENQSDIKSFTKEFQAYYGKKMMNTYPKFALLGYDTGNYFLNAVHTYGADFENHLSEYKSNTAQIALDFKRINNWGGFINTGFYFVHYDEYYNQKREYWK